MLRSSGAVTDRPWGLTLATLGTQEFTGLLTMTADGKEYSISFDLGRIVGATSPLASDAAARMALTTHLVSSSRATDLHRQIVAAKDRDELEVLAELAGLTPELVHKLRHRLAAQRSARTFALDNGTYVAEERIAMLPGADLDVREVIYLGARMNLSEQRLAVALRKFGSVFTIKPEAIPSLDQFGFTPDAAPVLESLHGGASMAQLEAAHREIDTRMVQAIVYALASAGACHIERSSTNPANVIEYEGGPEVTPRTTTATHGATYFVSRAPTHSTLARVPGDPDQPSDPLELPSPTEISNPPRRAHATTGRTSARAPARPSVDEGIARIPPSASRTPTGQLTGSRTQTSDPASARTRTGQPATALTQTSEPALSRTETGEPIVSLPPADSTGFREPVVPRTTTPRPGAGSSGVRAPGQPTIPKGTRTGRPDGPGAAEPADGGDAARHPEGYAAQGFAVPRTQTSDPVVARTASSRPVGPAVARTSTARRTQALIAARLILVEQAADYFTLLGVPFDAPIDVVQTAYLDLVRQLHPDKLEELGVPDTTGNAQRVFHQVGLAFSVLTDPARRAIYLDKLGTPTLMPTPAIEMTARTRTADDIPASPAGDAFRRGEGALRFDEPAEAVVEFGRACALEPNNVDFHAMLGWAQFCAARDKVTIAPETRKALDRAVQRSAKPTQARFLLGRVERMLGRDREALRHFQEVVDTSAHHADAAAEIRAIEARLAKSPGKR